jgi:DNA-binding transcriptional regulator LsrR (DeoR family)
MIDQGMTQKDIAESLGLDKSYVSRIKSQAEKDGHIGANGKLTQSGYIYIHGA